MRLFLNIVGLLFYCFSIYCMFFSNPGESGSLFQIVGGDAYNYNYAFLAAITFSVIGTGFIVIASSHTHQKNMILIILKKFLMKLINKRDNNFILDF